jgi:hypothetical protein
VAEVQGILTDKFHQLIHAPPPPPPPGRSPGYYTVSGAGNATWNGRYVRTEEVSEMSSDLTYATKGCGDCSLYSNGGVWRLAIRGEQRAPQLSAARSALRRHDYFVAERLFGGAPGNDVYYVAPEATGLPPTAGWEVGAGTAPAPKLVAGPL